ncbi:MAG: hypothetical protein GY745_22190, partial [Actinomycetia bacterium]|nr:hypothetical protein [Actinomycetes bacterium]
MGARELVAGCRLRPSHARWGLGRVPRHRSNLHDPHGGPGDTGRGGAWASAVSVDSVSDVGVGRSNPDRPRVRVPGPNPHSGPFRSLVCSHGWVVANPDRVDHRLECGTRGVLCRGHRGRPRGGKGVDEPHGRRGADTLYGGIGDDTLDGGDGTDTCDDGETNTECETETTIGDANNPGPGPNAVSVTQTRTYDHDGQLVEIAFDDGTSTETTGFSWDNNRPIPQIITWTDTNTTNILYGNTRTAAIGTAVDETFAYNPLGDVIDVGTGSLAGSASFGPFGSPDGAFSRGFGFRGELHVAD